MEEKKKTRMEAEYEKEEAMSIVHLSSDLRDELDAIVSRYDEMYMPGGVPSAELTVALLRALGGSERVAVEKLRDLCQSWLDTGTWPDEE